MKLNIKDRLYIPQIFPESGNFIDFNLKRKIMEKIAITEEDKATYEIKEDKENQRITWNFEKDYNNPIEVSFSDDEKNYLVRSCESLTDKNFPDDFWIVVEKIYNTKNS